MSRLNPEYVRLTCSKASESGYFTLLSMKLMDFQIGSSLLELEIQPKHLQPFGVVHGGVFASVIDAAAFWSVFPELPPGQGMTTVDLKVNYLAPAVSGKIVVKGKRIKMGKTLGLAEATIIDASGRVLAHGTSTVMALPDQNFIDNDQLPEKFVE